MWLVSPKITHARARAKSLCGKSSPAKPLPFAFPCHFLPPTFRLFAEAFADIKVNAARRRQVDDGGIKFGGSANDAAFACAGAHEPTHFRFVPMLRFL